MQNNSLVEKMILSKTGKDKNHLYVIIGHLSDDHVVPSNRNIRTVQMLKKKSLKHINVLEDVDDEIKASIISKDGGTDLEIRRFLKLKGIVKEG